MINYLKQVGSAFNKRSFPALRREEVSGKRQNDNALPLVGIDLQRALAERRTHAVLFGEAYHPNHLIFLKT